MIKPKTILFVGMIVLALLMLGLHSLESATPEPQKISLNVVACDDFEINGQGDAAAWKKAEWATIDKRDNSKLDYQTRLKILYSTTGIYLLFDGDDKKLTAKMDKDFSDLWKEDVFECFLWTDEKNPLYFEYEISPLGYELPLMIPNLEGKQLGWLPWHYDGDRKIKKAVHISGGEQKSMSTISGWRAEVFIPYKLFKPLQNVPPKAGTKWRANFYRVDYDSGRPTEWQWSPIVNTFHDFKNFGTLVFQ
jgi:hypothetical protein